MGNMIIDTKLKSNNTLTSFYISPRGSDEMQLVAPFILNVWEINYAMPKS